MRTRWSWNKVFFVAAALGAAAVGAGILTIVVEVFVSQEAVLVAEPGSR
jgi:hypothetical protein